jgi:hypothetical protein
MFKLQKTLIFIISLLLLAKYSFSIHNKEGNFLSANTQLTCSNSIMGFKGQCLSDASKILNGVFPDRAKKSMSFLMPIISMSTKLLGLDFCVGDYKASVLGENSSLGKMTCADFPINEDHNYGVVGAYINNVPCGSPQTVAVCVAFDTCGTVTFSMNGGVAACAASTTGIGAIITPLSGILDSIHLGFSLNRRFERTFTVLVRKGNSLETKKITTRGHFYLGLNLSIPIDFIKIGKKSLKDIFDLRLSSLFMVDLGAHIGSTLTQLVDTMTSGKPDKNFTKNIMNIGSELTVEMKGKLALKLEDLTEGFLDDIELELGQANAYITRNLPDNATGLTAGVYMYLKSDILKNLFSIVENLLSDFGPILKQIKFIRKAIPSSQTYMGLFITTEAMGMSMSFGGNTIMCMFIYSKKNGSCSFNGSFFTALIEGAKWVIKEAKELFDNTGKEIVRFTKGVGKFAKMAASAVKDKMENLAKEAEKAAKEAKKLAEETGKKVAKETQKAAEKVKDTGKKVAKETEKAAEKVKDTGKKVAKETEKAANKVKDALSKW